MEVFQALVLGIVQGLTEWLPLSSSGHLALAQLYMGEGTVAYDVVLHVATLAVVIVYFRKDVVAIVGDWARGISEATRPGNRKAALFGKKARLWGWLILLASIPTAIIGFLLDRYLGGGDFTSLAFLGAGFIVTGIFLATTYFAKPKERQMGAPEAATVGAAQGLSVFSSLSRSGLTVGAAALMGVSREDAGKFSFLAMIPAVIGAAALKIFDIGALARADLLPMAVGALAAALVGFLCLKAMMFIAKRNGMWWFAPYCVGLGVALLAWPFIV
ncbi:MAG: undecaprenyl-diphosphate phosphatase [Euryarchaeota archaeon]|nr:undecaprenyl-diphosphate phosphatase [Euryarchaeota archaeon]